MVTLGWTSWTNHVLPNILESMGKNSYREREYNIRSAILENWGWHVVYQETSSVYDTNLYLGIYKIEITLVV